MTLAAALGMVSAPLKAQWPRGVPGDLAADKVFGKPDFTEITPYTTVAGRLFIPHGVIVDRSDPARNKLYVYDSGNNRILGIDLNTCRSSQTNPLGCTPTIVIGQPTMNTSACNGDSGFQNYPSRAPATASTLCGETETQTSITEGGSGASMAVDAAGNLYVADFWNNRVLKYERPFETDTVADDVWGQNDFQSNGCDKGYITDATTLCFGWGSSNNWTAGVDVDRAGNLWVTDSGSSRVLRFPPGSKTADLVLGQHNFNGRSPGQELNQLLDPSAVRVSPATGWVYVAESGNNRVLVFKPPFVTGMAGELFGSDFLRPQGLDFDPLYPGSIWICNLDHNTIELWTETTGAKTMELGRRDDSGVIAGASGSIGIDSSGSVYVAVLRGLFEDDVVTFDRGVSLDIPTRRLFGSTPGGNLPTASGLGWSVEGVVVSDGQLIVADNDRLLFWNNPLSAASGQPADGYAAGAASFADFEYGCCGVAVADGNHHLFVAGAVSSPGVVHVYQLPLTLGATPIFNLAPPFAVIGGGLLTGADTFTGLAVSDGSELWISQSLGNRVFRLREPMSAPMVDVVLGQVSPNETACNRNGTAAPDTLCRPGHASLDRRGNLFISDHSLEIAGNIRLLEFPANSFPSGNTEVIYAPPAAKIIPQVATWQPAFDSANHMVIGYNPYGPNLSSHFPGIFSDPLSNETRPNTFLQDFFSMAYSAAFDENDNLYVADLNRARVLFYEKPMASLPAITDFAPGGGLPGDVVVIRGRNLGNTATVAFSGVLTRFEIDSDTQLRATVPASASTGAIAIASPRGGARSLTDFLVTPARSLVKPCCVVPTPKPAGPRGS